jgi:hypothetical protein
MAAIDDLAGQAVAAVEYVARRGAALAIGVALIALLICGSSFLTGLAAMDGSVETAWIVLGGTLLVIAVGAPLLAWWRLARVRRHANALVGEVRRLASRSPEAEQIVIETVAVDPEAGSPATPAVIGQSAQFTRLRTIAIDAGDLRELPGALRAVTLFPALLGIALLLCLVFAILGFLFLVALAL